MTPQTTPELADMSSSGKSTSQRNSHSDGEDALHAAAVRATELSRLVARALRCCVDMLTNLHGFSPTAGVVLDLHMGIGAGPLSAFYVGGDQVGR